MAHRLKKLQDWILPTEAPPIIRTLFSLGFALGLTLFTLNFHFSSIDAFFYDLKMRTKWQEKPDDRIILLALDQNASLKEHLIVLKKLIAQKPQAIAYLNRFESSAIQADWNTAEEFVDTAKQKNTNVIFGTDMDLSGEILPPYPLSLLPHYFAIIHKDGNTFARDKVSRRALLTIQDEPSLYLRLAYPNLSNDQLKNQAQHVKGAYYFNAAESWHTLIHYLGNTAWNNNIFTTINFSSVLSNNVLPNLNNKIILIDTIHSENMNDYYFTPYSQEQYVNPKIIIHASILNTLLKNNGIVSINTMIIGAIILMLSFLLTYFILKLSPLTGVICVILVAGIFFAINTLLFYFFSLDIRTAQPLFAIVSTYYLVVPYRAILEYKRRWEVQKKHDLLLQVEEMKKNFLSLMSHDLKTPVARIQGLAELMKNQNVSAEEKQEAIDQIMDSTENLNKFISKILDLTKIEANEIKLNIKAKDINKLIEKCVANLEFQARQKNITIELELEPLFPIEIDASLMVQVFTNLIDNAIKYSPSGSKIKIRSKEIGENVKIEVVDAGPGFDEEEAKHAFTKFYRGKNPAATAVKGSGLGLYLSKYFIELHQGSINLESAAGSGSKFNVLLPQENRELTGEHYV